MQIPPLNTKEPTLGICAAKQTSKIKESETMDTDDRDYNNTPPSDGGSYSTAPPNTPPYGEQQNNPPQYGAPPNAPPPYGEQQYTPPTYGDQQNNPPQYGAPQNAPPPFVPPLYNNVPQPGVQCRRCGFMHSPLDPICPQCGEITARDGLMWVIALFPLFTFGIGAIIGFIYGFTVGVAALPTSFDLIAQVIEFALRAVVIVIMFNDKKKYLPKNKWEYGYISNGIIIALSIFFPNISIPIYLYRRTKFFGKSKACFVTGLILNSIAFVYILITAIANATSNVLASGLYF
jgi:hypothetical protein